MKYSIYIVEDEKPALNRLKKIVSDLPEALFIGCSETGKKAVEEIDRLKPDILLLDIHLSDMAGIDILPLISHKPKVIFTTAFDNYAVQAFELQAVDYLLKPFTEERLQEAIKKAVSRLQSLPENFNEIKQLLSQWQPQNDYLTRIPSRIGDKIYILNDDDIIYFSSEDKYVLAYLYDKKYVINFTLEQLEARLDPSKFFRIHRSKIVNLNYVDMIEPLFAGGYCAVVKDKSKTELSISRTAGKKLKEKLGW
jgi:DNA-binding LytR/AlgR family response regulator